MSKKILSLEVDEKGAEKIDEIIKVTKSAGFAELCRRSFALYHATALLMKNGGKLIFRHADGSDEEFKEF
jgi:hypothetical protein